MFSFRKWFQTPRKRKPIVNADRRRSNRIRVILEALEDRVNPSAIVTTDLLDYAPGSTALISTNDFLPGTDITFQVLHVLDAGADGLFGTADDTLDALANSTGSGHDPWTVTDGGLGDLDGAANGSVFTSWYVHPDDSLGATFVLSASGLSMEGTMVSASTMFTDAKASANLDQFANLDNDWVNGNLGGTKANYMEGESVPYRLLFDNLSTSDTHTVTISWDTTKDGKHALDYLTSFNLSESPDPLEGVGDLGSHPLDTEAIPLDPNVSGAGVTQIPGLFSLFGGTITAVSAYTFIPPIDPYNGTSTTQITITFTASVDNPVLAWGGHIATRLDWGSDSSAVAISGSPFHTRLVALDGSGGNQDKSLSSDAVIFPGSITIIKDALPDSSQDFSFTITGGLSPSSFLLDDDSDLTLSNTMLFGSITTFTTYTITEAATPNWLLDSITSSSTSGNGGTVTFDLGAGSATITLKEGENVTVTFKNKEDAPPTISIVKTVDADEDGTFNDSESVAEGGVGDQLVDYKFVISNTSLASTDPVTITSLVDDKLGDLLAIFTAANGGSAVIPFGGSATFFVNDFTVPTQNAGTDYTNLVTANAKDDENTSTNQATADAVVTYTDVLPLIHIEKSADPLSVPEGGVGDQTVTYTYLVTNTSPAGAFDPLSGVTLTDSDGTPSFVSGDDGDGLLEFDETWIFSLVTTAPIQNAGTDHTNTASASGFDDESNPAFDDDDAIITYTDVLPLIHIEKSADPLSVPEGGVGDQTVTYTYLVTNTSPAGAFDPLSGVTLTDSDGTPSFVSGDDGDGLLEFDETWIFSLVTTAPTQNAGTDHTNTASASGFDDESNPAFDDDDAIITYTDVLPLIHIEKSADPLSVPEGGVGDQTVTYTYLVTNTSPAGAFDPLSGVTLTDSDGTPSFVSGDDGDGLLEFDETWIFSLVTTAPIQNAGTDHTNTASASGFDDESNPAFDDDDAIITYTDVLPLIHIEKSADPLSVPEGGVGDQTVTYTYLVTNTSPAGAFDPLSGVTLTDSDGTPSFVSGDDGDGLLEFDETWIFSLVTTAPTQNAGTDHTNTASASGFDDESNPAFDDDDAIITYTDVLPLIHIEKSADPLSVPEGGVGDQTVTYTYLVTNTSPAGAFDPLSGVTLTDSDGTPSFVSGDDGDGLLEFDETWIFSLVTTAPIQNAGTDHTNTASASGFDDESNPAFDDDDAIITYTDVLPLIHIEKSADPLSVPEGGVGDQTVTYTYLVTNTSPAGAFDPLSGVTLTDSDGTPSFVSGDDGDGLLEFDETWIFSLVTTAPTQNAGTDHTNTASASGFDDESNPAFDDDDAIITYTDVLPLIHIEKSADPLSVPEGGVGDQTVTYTYLVTNTSPAGAFDPLSGVTLTDSDGTPSFVSGDDGDGLLEFDETWIFSLVTTAPIQNAGTDHTNTASASGFDDESNPAFDDDDAIITYTDVLPLIHIEKSADPLSVPEGGVGDQTVTYTYLVTNTSPAGAFDPLSGVTLTDSDGTPSFVSGDDGDGLLEFDETWIFSLVTTAPTQNAGTDHTNTASASGFDDESNPAFDDDDATITYEDANIAAGLPVEKTVDADGDGIFSDIESVLEGGVGDQQVNYRFVLTNDTPVTTDPLTITSVMDNKLGDLYADALAAFQLTHPGATEIVLQAGESLTFFIVDFIVPAANASDSDPLTLDTYINTLTVEGHDDDGVPYLTQDIAEVTYLDVAPSIDVTKTPDQTSVVIGKAVTYTYLVTNNSPAGTYDPLSDVVLVDDDGAPTYISGDTNDNLLLEAGETWTYILTVEIKNLGPHTNKVVATGTDDEVNQAIDDASATVQVVGEQQDGKTLGYYSNKNGRYDLTGSFNGSTLRDEIYTVLFAPDTGLLAKDGTFSVLVSANGNYIPLTNFHSFSFIKNFLLNAKAKNMAHMLSAQLLTTEFNVVLGRVDATRCIFVSLVPLSSAGVASISPLLNPDGTITVQAILDAAIASLKTNPYTVALGDARIYQDALKTLLDAINNNGSIFVPCPPSP